MKIGETTTDLLGRVGSKIDRPESLLTHGSGPGIAHRQDAQGGGAPALELALATPPHASRLAHGGMKRRFGSDPHLVRWDATPELVPCEQAEIGAR